MLVYVGTAHLALLMGALFAVGSAPEIALSFLHPATLATVHFVTLGWLTATALGAVYALLPMILRTRVDARWPDVLACIGVLGGASGVIAHMLLATWSGVAWAGGMIAAGAGWIGLRTVAALAHAPAPRLPRVAVGLAYVSLVAAAVLGTLAAIHRASPIFPGGHLRTLAAHAHLALVGWLGLLTVGIGHRLLPMLIPAAPIAGSRPAWTVALLALGAVALPATWLLAPWPSRLPALAAAPLALGMLLFVLDLLVLSRQRKPKAKGLPRRDPALVLIPFAMACMIGGVGLGFVMLGSEFGPAWAGLYGVLLLVGGFGGLVLGVGLRLWPLFAWMRGFARTQQVPGITPGDLPSYPLQWLVVGAWILAVVGLAVGILGGSALVVRLGALAWVVAALAVCVNLWLVLLRARRAFAAA